ncbi:MAG: hypothetical protein ACI4I6_06180 [Hominimerdicola sp.]
MKKIAAIMVSLIMTCAIATGCGSSDDSSSASSKADSSASSSAEVNDSTDDESTADESAADSKNKSDKTLAEQFVETLSSDNYSMIISTSDESMGDVVMTVAYAGEDSYFKYEMMGYTMEAYSVDGYTYTLDSSTKSYYKTESQGDSVEENNAENFLPEGYKFVSSEETEDGLICEIYTIPVESYDDLSTESTEDSAATNEATIKFYFNSDGVIQKFASNESGEEYTMDITDFKSGDVTIELPDLSEWEEKDASSLFGDIDTEIIDEDIVEDETSSSKAAEE